MGKHRKLSVCVAVSGKIALQNVRLSKFLLRRRRQSSNSGGGLKISQIRGIYLKITMASLPEVAALIFACRTLRHNLLFGSLIIGFKILAVYASQGELSPLSPNFPDLPFLAAQRAAALFFFYLSFPHDNFISRSTIISPPRRIHPYR